jgi:hypothetical protein
MAFFVAKKTHWKKMKTCLRREIILNKQNPIFEDVKWVAYVF